MNNNSFFVTTPIYYVNDAPHIGHAYTSIACDVLARFNRLKDLDVMFLTGTDEHGLKIEQAAKKENLESKVFVDQMSLHFKELSKTLNISNDNFEELQTNIISRHPNIFGKFCKTIIKYI